MPGPLISGDGRLTLTEIAEALDLAHTMALNIAFFANIKTYPNHLARLDQQPYDRIRWACVTGTNGR